MASAKKAADVFSGSPVSVVGSRSRYVDVWIWFSYFVLVVGIIVAVTPFFWMISASLMTLGEATGRAILPATAQWDNYQQAWVIGKFSEYFFNSVQITAITIAGQVVFCTLAAYAFASMGFPAKNFLFALLLTTLMLPEAVTWVPNFITVTWLGRIGPIPWVNNWPALTIPFMASAFNIFLLRQFFSQMPPDLWDSAQIDGAGHLRYLLQIVLPISRAALVTVIIFGFVGAWNSLAWPMLVTNSDEWRPISAGLQHFLDEAGSYVHWQMAGAVITILPILVLYLVAQKQFTEGIATSGLKG
ncbi:MAG: carbohydrate ABC transporter permease [Anaerolineae bacterium]|jgi:ABC-type glycerol-3-phosphate transport system permease component|nr:carbohydrate ABC transporter permease [Anaerolineae bacterium]